MPTANLFRWLGHLRIVVLLLLGGPALAGPRIAIIIDDLGNLRDVGERAAALAGPVAFAILPHTPHARYLADLATRNGKEVLLHLPLDSVATDNQRSVGHIELDLTRVRFGQVFRANLTSVPHATGVNTHMGSLITQHPGHMSWLMGELQQRGNLFFVDSRTTPASVALQMAREFGVPSTRRDVFLDNDTNPRAIADQFRTLLNLARARGGAVGIGHPRPETLALLEKELPQLTREGVRLVPVREIIDEQQLVALQ